MKIRPLFEDRALPAVIEGDAGAPSPDHLLDLLSSHHAVLADTLSTVGAILLRGFGVRTSSDLARIVRAFGRDPIAYVGGDSPRSRIEGQVYTSTEYPAAYEIAMHSEMSYWHTWPSKLFLFCEQAPAQGGETPIVDCRRMLAELEGRVRDRFLERGVQYLQTLGDGPGLGRAWQQTFDTDDPAVATEICRRGGVEVAWDAATMRTRHVRPAAATHPTTGDEVWFNQADLWHPSSLPERIRASLLAVLPEDDLYHNARYGDGSAIDPADLQVVRTTFRRHASVFPWVAGDVLVVDNMLVGHGRSSFVGPRRILAAMS